jgi:hypothetical protein
MRALAKSAISYLQENLCRAVSTELRPLVAIKLLHTVVWVFFAGCILAIPIAGAKGEFRWAAALTAAVLLECAILGLNRGRCPLTDLAGRYTKERSDNFDIYLPLWLARHNKWIFGTLFLVFEVYLLALYVASYS